MKQKDAIFGILAVVILLVAGYIAYTKLLPSKANSKASTAVSVETAGPIDSELDRAGMLKISDGATVKNYNSPYDLSGLGNTAPFGQ